MHLAYYLRHTRTGMPQTRCQHDTFDTRRRLAAEESKCLLIQPIVTLGAVDWLLSRAVKSSDRPFRCAKESAFTALPGSMAMITRGDGVMSGGANDWYCDCKTDRSKVWYFLLTRVIDEVT